ncbi:phosphoadenosine phosphosulfate reductase [Litorivita pollutaquae]|uniref:Phosphoadenosine phosphosulfate reductase n=1 Tax=Litorivita pollutaquae TaxID=2200892 RepID=A0A2V4N132_9RHOB|nr:phosphoadenosine phosphosulfate reductase [Litorivita pollutaquae]OUS22024.1 phosphoadenosine phosphosulfate reductase [Rhodobacterales bacterium 59_46_T64]PYC48494.1 phosphoadenosine phosphosulfate reductase [Litorivita pollutaquae]
MQDGPHIIQTSLADLKKSEWIEQFSRVTDEAGYVQTLGKRHLAGFVDEGPTLLVTFETIQGIQTLSEQGHPIGWDLVRAQGWSHLAIISDGDTWFRDARIYGYFDRLIDDGFFEDFEKVIFYGTGPCGYAAAAYSVAAPGASVLAIQPQATLDAGMTEWDDRFTHMRRTSFTDRYGYAPDMLDAAAEAFVIYDPNQDLDAMHAALFTRSNVTKLRCRNLGEAIQSHMLQMGVLPDLINAMGQGALNEVYFGKAMRARRGYGPYLRRLMSIVDNAERPYLTAMVCENVLSRMHGPRFRKKLTELRALSARDGTKLPPAPKTDAETDESDP